MNDVGTHHLDGEDGQRAELVSRERLAEPEQVVAVAREAEAVELVADAFDDDERRQLLQQPRALVRPPLLGARRRGSHAHAAERFSCGLLLGVGRALGFRLLAVHERRVKLRDTDRVLAPALPRLRMRRRGLPVAASAYKRRGVLLRLGLQRRRRLGVRRRGRRRRGRLDLLDDALVRRQHPAPACLLLSQLRCELLGNCGVKVEEQTAWRVFNWRRKKIAEHFFFFESQKRIRAEKEKAGRPI